MSAMKGAGKGKEVAQQAKLRVSWAPDVYDPPATSVSHALKSHNPYHRHRRSSKQKDQHHKNKQKKTKHLHGSNGVMKNHTGCRKHSGRYDHKHNEQRSDLCPIFSSFLLALWTVLPFIFFVP